MSIAEIKSIIHQRVEQTEDEAILNEVLSFINKPNTTREGSLLPYLDKILSEDKELLQMLA